MGTRLLRLVAVAAMSLLWIRAQTLRPEFEVAAVRLVTTPSPPHSVSLNISHGRVTLQAAALRQIIGLAYGIQRVRVQGGGAWLDSDLFDIVAKCENADTTRDEVRSMLRTLLEERFQLAAHRETKNLPVYTLAVAKNGSKLQHAKDDEKPAAVARVGRLAYRKTSIATLVNTLANLLGNPVLDKTGIQGLYDINLEWAADDGAAASGNGGKPLDAGQSGPSLFTSLEEQLGLKLSAEKGPVEVLLIDRAMKPSAN